MSRDICEDNRFEIIEADKKKLIESTNIESSPKEMEVLDNLLFRMWQMGWLPGCKELRNCDVGDPPIEQYNRWEIDVWHKCKEDDCENCHKWFDKVECFAAWSHLPFEAGNH